MHNWGEWKIDKTVHASCIQREMLYRTCSGCGETEYRYGDYGDHVWGEWHQVQAPTSEKTGLEERVCEIDPSHMEQREIPPTNPVPGLSPSLTASASWAEDTGEGKRYAGAIVYVEGTLTNTGNCELRLALVQDEVDRISSMPGGADAGDGTFHLMPGQSITFSNVPYGVYEKEVDAGVLKDHFGIGDRAFYWDGTEHDENYDYWKTQMVVCNSADFSIPLTYPDDMEELHPSLTASTSWAEDAGEGKRYAGAIVYVDHILTNTGNCDIWLLFTEDEVYGGTMNGEVFSGPIINYWDYEYVNGYYLLEPGRSITLSNHDYWVSQEEADAGVLKDSWGFGRGYYDNSPDDNSNDWVELPWCETEFSIPLTYPDGMEGEEPHPELTLIHEYDDPNQDIYEPDGKVQSHHTLMNTGNVELTVELAADGVDEELKFTLTPGDWFFGPCTISDLGSHVAPGTETEELMGSVPLVYRYIGYDKDTGEKLCESNAVERTYKVRKPGPAEWLIPDESDITAVLSVYPGWESADPAGYRSGEMYATQLSARNAGKVTIPENGITVYDPYDGYTIQAFSFELIPGDVGWWAWRQYGIVSEADVANGSIHFPPISFTWTDPESGNEKIAYSNALELKVINDPGLVLAKSVANTPANSTFFTEGEEIQWKLTVTNNSKEPIRNVTVTDQGNTVGTFPEIAAGASVPVALPGHLVSEYDVLAGTVSNYACATGEDLKGTAHTWVSNMAKAPTSEWSETILTTEKDKDGSELKKGGGETKKDDADDPKGPIYGLKVGAAAVKAEAHAPANGLYYELNEAVDFVITVKNTGDVPLENVYVLDSLGGFTPIGSTAAIDPGNEESFPFTWTVTQGDIDKGYVLNSATIGYEFNGGIAGTPVKSNYVIVPAGEKGPDIVTGIMTGGSITGSSITGGGISGGSITGGSITGGITGSGSSHFTPIPPTGKDGSTDGGAADGSGSGGAVNCELRLDLLGGTEARYTLHACGEHAAAAQAAEAAGKAGNPAEAVNIWREEVNKLYEIFHEAADDEGKAALIQERTVFFDFANAQQALLGDEAAAELLRLKCTQMCCIIHTLPAELPDSLTGSYAKTSSPAYSLSERIISELNGSDSGVTEHYGAGEAIALGDVMNLLHSAKQYNYDEVFLRGQRIWQVALDGTVNEAYKAADKDARKRIVTWRKSLDTLYSAEKALMNLIYPDNRTTVEETLMNLYRNAAFDIQKIR